MFTGIVYAERLGRIFEVILLPFVRDIFHDGHACNRTMISNMQAVALMISSRRMESIGGPHPLSHWILTP